MRRYLQIMVLVAALGVGLTQPPIVLAQTTAPPAAPDSAAVSQGRRLLDAIAGMDDANFLRALHTLYPSSKMTDAEWLEFRPNWKAFAFHGVEQSTPTQAALSVYDGAREDWVKILVSVEAAPPHAITEFGIRAGRRPSDVPAPPKLEPLALVAAAEAEAADEARQDRFSGVVMIARNGKTLFERAYGLADRGANRPMTVDAKLRIGSMGKMFTTVAVLQLAQAGKLDLGAPIGRYLPDYPNREIATTVTVDELLNHAGGTGDFFGPEFEAHRQTLVDPKDYIARFGARPPLFPAGTQQAYSNFGFIILGRIVEAVSGEPYDQYVEDHIFKPAGMTGSGYVSETVAVPGRVVGYAQGPAGLERAKLFQAIRGTPAGGSYSTGPDMIRFADALMGGRLLNAAYLERITKTGTKLPNGAVSLYDFGGHHTGEGQLYYGHGGAAPGQNGVLHIFPDNGYVIVVLANRDSPTAERLAKFIEGRTP